MVDLMELENDILFKEFDSGSEFYIILKGKVGVYKFEKDVKKNFKLIYNLDLYK